MRYLTPLLCCALLFSGFRQEAQAWGNQGHTAMWQLAQSMLTPAAKAKLATLLEGEELDEASVWLDVVRASARAKKEGKKDPLANDADAQDLNTRFPTNEVWHYVDMPLGATSYATAKGFTAPDDIVQQIAHAIRVLQGQDKDMSERVAVRVLAHLVGDIHQPLHCASGFYDLSDLSKPRLITDPVAALPLKQAKIEDRGGNQIKVGKVNLMSLHLIFDVIYLKALAGGSEDPDALLPKLEAMAKTVDASTPGHVLTWAEHWATESLRLTGQAYAPLKFGECMLRTDAAEIEEKGKIDTIRITTPPNYEATQSAMLESQLAKAGVRLAAVLNGVWK